MVESVANNEIQQGYNDIFRGYGSEIELIGGSEKTFLRVKESLSRMLIKHEGEFAQVCFILHKRGRFAILHYSELLNLDGVCVDIDEKAISVRLRMVKLLSDWKLIKSLDSEKSTVNDTQITIIKYANKGSVPFKVMYNIGEQ